MRAYTCIKECMYCVLLSGAVNTGFCVEGFCVEGFYVEGFYAPYVNFHLFVYVSYNYVYKWRLVILYSRVA